MHTEEIIHRLREIDNPNEEVTSLIDDLVYDLAVESASKTKGTVSAIYRKWLRGNEPEFRKATMHRRALYTVIYIFRGKQAVVRKHNIEGLPYVQNEPRAKEYSLMFQNFEKDKRNTQIVSVPLYGPLQAELKTKKALGLPLTHDFNGLATVDLEPLIEFAKIFWLGTIRIRKDDPSAPLLFEYDGTKGLLAQTGGSIID